MLVSSVCVCVCVFVLSCAFVPSKEIRFLLTKEATYDRASPPSESGSDSKMKVPVSDLAGLPHLYGHPDHDPTLLAGRKDGLIYSGESGLMLPCTSKHSALQVNTKVGVRHESESITTTVTATATWTTTSPTKAAEQLQDGSTPSSDLEPCGSLSAHARLSQEAVEQHSQGTNHTLGSYNGFGRSVDSSEGESMTGSTSQGD